MDDFSRFESQESETSAPVEETKPNTDHINLRVVAQVRKLVIVAKNKSNFNVNGKK